MTGGVGVSTDRRIARVARLAAVVCLSALTGACASLTGDDAGSLLASSPPQVQAPDAPQLTDLEKATEYWGQQYAKTPQKAETALSYAKNLRASGRKQEAFAILQQAVQMHNSDKALAAEYGRLALEFDQTTLASQLLEFADDPSKPDWRVISARGAALAKLGRYKEAVVHLERAQNLAPNQASVKNNLALAYAMSGEPQRAEELLRRAVSADSSNAKTRQNLAIVLGLQGKYDEATQIGATALSPEDARRNTDLVRQIVKLEPQRSAPAAAPVPHAAAASGWAPTLVSESFSAQ